MWLDIRYMHILKMVSESQCELSIIFTKNCLEDKHLPKRCTWEGLEKINHLGISQASDRFMLYIHDPTPTRKYLLFLPLLHRVAVEMLRLWWLENEWECLEQRAGENIRAHKLLEARLVGCQQTVQFLTQVRRQRRVSKSRWLTELGQDGETKDCQLLSSV